MDGRDVPALAVCRGCGAAVCLEHTGVSYVAGHPAGMVGPAQSMTRQLWCPFCSAGRSGTRSATKPGELAAQPCADPSCLCPPDRTS